MKFKMLLSSALLMASIAGHASQIICQSPALANIPDLETNSTLSSNEEIAKTLEKNCRLDLPFSTLIKEEKVVICCTKKGFKTKAELAIKKIPEL